MLQNQLQNHTDKLISKYNLLADIPTRMTLVMSTSISPNQYCFNQRRECVVPSQVKPTSLYYVPKLTEDTLSCKLHHGEWWVVVGYQLT